MKGSSTARTRSKELGMKQDSKGVDCASSREDDGGEDDEELSDREAWRYRSLVATMNYLAMDRPVIQFQVGVLCRSMAKPKQSSWKKTKRAARYLMKHPEMN